MCYLLICVKWFFHFIIISISFVEACHHISWIPCTLYQSTGTYHSMNIACAILFARGLCTSFNNQSKIILNSLFCQYANHMYDTLRYHLVCNDMICTIHVSNVDELSMVVTLLLFRYPDTPSYAHMWYAHMWYTCGICGSVDDGNGCDGQQW